jgi:hypothetical protein
MTLMMALSRIKTGREREDGEPETYADVTTMHGLARTTFSTWANSERVAHADIVEAALAHGEADKVRAAYNRSRTEGERFERDLRALRDSWAVFVTTPPGKGTDLPLRTKARAEKRRNGTRKRPARLTAVQPYGGSTMATQKPTTPSGVDPAAACSAIDGRKARKGLKMIIPTSNRAFEPRDSPF